MRAQGEQPADLIRSVSRALRIIEEVSGSPRPLPVKVIARRCQLNLSTTYHLVRTLCYEGYLVRLPGGGYAAGSEVAGRFHDVMGSLNRPARARAVLRHLADVTGHSAYLACISGGRLVVVDVIEGAQSPWLEDLQPGLETAAHATAVGKALLTTLPGRARGRLLREHGMRPFTPNTVTEPGQIEYELGQLRPGDMVIEHGQFRDEVCCAGVAVRGHDGGWWSVGSTARGLSLPGPLLAELRVAAADLARAGSDHLS
ncbi:MAG TPA: IclR family transcriptional regulator C-terminal domain-containing protein [Streptosporangiaceae bacterium]|nr:IclR family transcriptional regulator C-terminal domain-containing protein [Streptosporangiaceae bacterium]